MLTSGSDPVPRSLRFKNFLSCPNDFNPILHTWFRDSCFTCVGPSTVQVFPLLFNIALVIYSNHTRDLFKMVEGYDDIIFYSITFQSQILSDIFSFSSTLEVNLLGKGTRYIKLVIVECIIILGLQGSVSCTTCQLFGSLIHFFWLTFFAWTGDDQFEISLASLAA
jgi:hypothetical protein